MTDVFETSVERRKQFLREFYPDRLTKIKDMAMKAVDGTKENFVNVCLQVNMELGKLDQEVFYSWLWQYASIYY